MRLIVLHEIKWTDIELMFVLIAHNTQRPVAKVLFYENISRSKMLCQDWDLTKGTVEAEQVYKEQVL